MKTALSRLTFWNAIVAAAACGFLRQFILPRQSGKYSIVSAYLPGRHPLHPRHARTENRKFLSEHSDWLHQPPQGEVRPDLLSGWQIFS